MESDKNLCAPAPAKTLHKVSFIPGFARSQKSVFFKKAFKTCCMHTLFLNSLEVGFVSKRRIGSLPPSGVQISVIMAGSSLQRGCGEEAGVV